MKHLGLVAILLIAAPLGSAKLQAQDSGAPAEPGIEQQLGVPAEAVADDPLASLSLAKKIKLAKAGDQEAVMAVAEAYELGLDTKIDLALAARWYRDAALSNNLEAQYRLARIVSIGAKGLNRDVPTAIKLYTSAANKGHAGSQYEMGQAFRFGNGVTQDDEKATELFRKSADQKFASAENALGLSYLYGKGIQTSPKNALEYFRRAADQGDPWALNNLAGMYEQGWGVSRDLNIAREYYVKASAKGIAIAETNLKRLSAGQQPAKP